MIDWKTLYPKHIAWAENSPGKGAVMNRMQSKEYRAFRFKGGVPDQWPGTDIFEVPDKETASGFVRNGDPKGQLKVTEEPSR